jgi:zinc protease
MPNGLQVVLAPDPRSNQVFVAVRYATGHAHDPRGYRGMAHLVEHLTFRASRHLRAFEGTDIIERLGGGYSAFTDLEETVYLSSAAARHLPTLLWLESERMAFSIAGVNPEALRLEKRIVSNELAEHTSSLDRMLFRQRLRTLYGLNHAFTPAADESADVNAVELPGVQWFMQKVYRPDNATLAIVGGFSSAAARLALRQYFGAIRSHATARLSGPAPGPRLCGAHRVSVGHAFLLGRTMTFDWPLARVLSLRDRTGLDALSDILGARLRSALMDEAAMASSIDLELRQFGSHALLSMTVEVLDPPRWGAIESAVKRELRALAEQPVSAGEMRSARATLLSDAVFSFDDPLWRAIELVQGRIDDLPAKRAAIEAQSSQTVQAAARSLSAGHLVLRGLPRRDATRETMLLSEEDPCP